MAYVITAVGAGGKTTYLRKRAKEFLQEGKRVAITTTTHIWPPRGDSFLTSDVCGQPGMRVWYGQGNEPDYYGRLEQSGKLSALSDEQFHHICSVYDAVLVEGDGSHCMPVKIPGDNEPVVPENSDEIAVIMGAHALGRRIDVVCHRYQQLFQGQSDENDLCKPLAEGHVSCISEERFIGDNTLRREVCKGELQKRLQGNVTEKMLRTIADYCYIDRLRYRYPRAKISYVLSRMERAKGKIAAVVMASGFGRRYGGNKLLDLYHGRPLYHHVMEHVTDACGTENTVAVTQYAEIADEVRAMGACAVMNTCAQEGIAASIRLGTEWAVKAGADAVIFFAADMPNLPSEEIRFYAEQFLASGKPYGCMVFGPDHICTNPGAFRLENGASRLLGLTGDRGAMRIMKKEPWNIYYYQIAPECCEDIDVKA